MEQEQNMCGEVSKPGRSLKLPSKGMNDLTNCERRKEEEERKTDTEKYLDGIDKITKGQLTG